MLKRAFIKFSDIHLVTKTLEIYQLTEFVVLKSAFEIF